MKTAKILTLLTITLLFFSCQTELDDNLQTGDINLVSPNGHVLAEDLSGVIDIIVNNSETVTKASIEVDDIKHFDEEDYTVSIIEYTIDGVGFSMLATNNLGDDYITLVDSKSVQFVKVVEDVKLTDDNKTIVVQKEDVEPTYTMSTFTCGGNSCCGFTHTGPNSFRCACGPAGSLQQEDDPEFEVGKGCSVTNNG